MDGKDRLAAAQALAHVVIDTLDPEPTTTLPFPLTKKEQSIRALRTKRDGQQERTTQDLPTMPSINALSFTIRYLPGGRVRFLEFVKLAAMNGDVAADAWWKVFSDLSPTQRDRCNFDDVCTASGVKPSALLAGIVGHGMEAATDMGNLVAAALHPEVIAKAGESALRIDGPHAEVAQVDRIHLLQARGFLPIPKGAQTHLHVTANAQAAASSVTDPSVPKFASDMSFLDQSQRAVQHQLAEALPVESIDAVPYVTVDGE